VTTAERTPKREVRFESTQTAQISLKPIVNEQHSPDVPQPPSSKPPTPLIDFIKPNTHVYALWLNDDRLVHEGIVLRKQEDSNNYIVQRSSLPDIETIILRENIFLESELKRVKTLPAKSCILVEYREHLPDCWKPAVILPSDNEKETRQVRFYDCMIKDISNNEMVIPISEKTFENYTKHRIEYEKALIDHVIVGLNSPEKIFMLGTIIKRVGYGHTYIIQWCDEKKSEQEEEYLFGAFTTPIQCQPNDYVLAMDNDQYIYKLALVITKSNDQKTLTVRFIDSKENNREIDVPSTTTFVITKPHYNSIMNKLSSDKSPVDS
ncbi:unnamed protein product, partial [Rotaria sp. Silwood1]